MTCAKRSTGKMGAEETGFCAWNDLLSVECPRVPNGRQAFSEMRFSFQARMNVAGLRGVKRRKRLCIVQPAVKNK